MSRRWPAWMTRLTRGTRPAGGRPSTGVPLNETEAERMARERGEREALTTRVDARRMERVIRQREARLALEAEERRHHRRLTNEEIKEELEHGLPIVPRTSPTRRNPRHAPGTPSPLARPTAEPHPGQVEPGPTSGMPPYSPVLPIEPARHPGQAESSGSGKPTPEKPPTVPEKGRVGATLSPPKASPGYHPASDPGSPVKHASPFNLGGAFRGKSGPLITGI
jgi:hypothetical protein